MANASPYEISVTTSTVPIDTDHQATLVPGRSPFAPFYPPTSPKNAHTVADVGIACTDAANEKGAGQPLGMDDADLPYSPFGPTARTIIMILAGITGMMAPFASNIFLPAIADVAKDLDSTVSKINVAVSVFMIGLGIAPVVWGPMADQLGRRYAFSIGCFICTAASIGCALSNSYSMLMGMRFLQAVGGSSTAVVGAGTISDIYEPAQRGAALGIFFSGQMLGPVLGTILGAYVAQDLGWRWAFWLSVILSGICFLILTFVMPETQRMAVSRKRRMPLKGLPKDLHLQSPPKFSFQQMNILTMAPTLKLPYVAIPVAAMTQMMGSYYGVNVAISMLLARDYHYPISTIGLCYIALGAGSVAGAFFGGFISDYTLRRAQRSLCYNQTAQHGDGELGQVATSEVEVGASKSNAAEGSVSAEDQPYEARLQFSLVAMAVFPLSLIAYGWVMHHKAFIVFPLICQFICGFTVVAGFSAYSTYLVDLFTSKSSSITSLGNLFRCLYGALWSGVIAMVIDAWGAGWAFTFLGGITFVVTALTVTLYLKGQSWRRANPPTRFLNTN
ncbi:hypothetical protein IWQ60_007694 [Tieghemiomyces parasiticus]|uniref:Major facilitator superfamily (MFS) profile domain-containing protein n=1 Tax=Tieghemiomyces parasiticus TaxID=78921 RepID=A0A9W7ZZU3_9FUNG|nr:hypothetical protein IWQ60_007694 [Tieghemiomyces parasiticus]